MEEIKYVDEGSLATARSWERKFQLLPPQAGLIFVSVKPVPAYKGLCDTFEIVLGFTKKYAIEESTGMAVINKVLAKDIEHGMFTFRTRVFIGVEGSHFIEFGSCENNQ